MRITPKKEIFVCLSERKRAINWLRNNFTPRLKLFSFFWIIFFRFFGATNKVSNSFFFIIMVRMEGKQEQNKWKRFWFYFNAFAGVLGILGGVLHRNSFNLFQPWLNLNFQKLSRKFSMKPSHVKLIAQFERSSVLVAKWWSQRFPIHQRLVFAGFEFKCLDSSGTSFETNFIINQMPLINEEF